MEKQNKKTWINFKLSEEDRKKIEHKAEQEGRTLSDYCRRKALGL